MKSVAFINKNFYILRREFVTLACLNVEHELSRLCNILVRLQVKKMETLELGYKEPVGVKGMTELNRDAFSMKAIYPALEVDVGWMKILMKPLKTVRQKDIRIDKFEPLDSKGNKKEEVDPLRKILLLNPKVSPNYNSLRQHLEEQNKLGDAFLHYLDIKEDRFLFCSVQVGYDHFNAETILKWILPDDVGPVTGYSQCGHIIHLNLKDHHLPFKKLIGSVFIDKISSAKTVVNKTSNISNVYRNFEFEVLAGDDNLETIVKESDCRFQLDFGKVYWNSRLSTEHDRVVSSLPLGCTVFDVFAGIGPFAIPAARNRKCQVYANDLNPESFKWLEHNVTLNTSKKCRLSDHVKCFNLDGRDFLKTVLIPHVIRVLQGLPSDAPEKMFVVMNLPALAIDFLDVFPGCLSDITINGLDSWQCLTVFCYCFSNAVDIEADVKYRVEQGLGTTLLDDNILIRHVRNVAPKKEMMVATLKLSWDLLTKIKRVNSEPPPKKTKLLV